MKFRGCELHCSGDETENADELHFVGKESVKFRGCKLHVSEEEYVKFRGCKLHFGVDKNESSERANFTLVKRKVKFRGCELRFGFLGGWGGSK